MSTSGQRAQSLSINPKITSAGGLIVRFNRHIWETVLVGSGAPTIWRIPKGMQNDGESIEQTAIREVFEETGLNGTILELIGTGSWTYWYEGSNWDETCYFFLIRLGGGDKSKHDAEFEKVEWVSVAKSAELLHYQIEKEIALNAQALLMKYRPDYLISEE